MACGVHLYNNIDFCISMKICFYDWNTLKVSMDDLYRNQDFLIIGKIVISMDLPEPIGNRYTWPRDGLPAYLSQYGTNIHAQTCA